MAQNPRIAVVTVTNYRGYDASRLFEFHHKLQNSAFPPDDLADIVRDTVRGQQAITFAEKAASSGLPLFICDKDSSSGWMQAVIDSCHRIRQDGIDIFPQPDTVRTRAGVRHALLKHILESEVPCDGVLMLEPEKPYAVDGAIKQARKWIERGIRLGVIGRIENEFRHEYPALQYRTETTMNTLINGLLGELGLMGWNKNPDWMSGTRWLSREKVEQMVDNPPTEVNIFNYSWYLIDPFVKSLYGKEAVGFAKLPQRYDTRQYRLERNRPDTVDYRMGQAMAMLTDFGRLLCLSDDETSGLQQTFMEFVNWGYEGEGRDR